MTLFPVILGIIFLVILGVLGGLFYGNRKTPENLGIVNGELAALPSTPNAVSSQTRDQDRRVSPLIFKKDLDLTKATLLEALRAYGGIEVITESDRYIHAVAKTKILRFKDDLEFYFDVALGTVHFRSASRVGHSDMGMNRKRYEHITRLYNDMPA